MLDSRSSLPAPGTPADDQDLLSLGAALFSPAMQETVSGVLRAPKLILGAEAFSTQKKKAEFQWVKSQGREMNSTPSRDKGLKTMWNQSPVQEAEVRHPRRQAPILRAAPEVASLINPQMYPKFSSPALPRTTTFSFSRTAYMLLSGTLRWSYLGCPAPPGP